MNPIVYNVAALIGWLMVLIGSCMVNLPWGIVAGGASLLLLNFLGVWLARSRG